MQQPIDFHWRTLHVAILRHYSQDDESIVIDADKPADEETKRDRSISNTPVYERDSAC